MRFVIVDGYSTGTFLVRQLLDRGASCVHVASQPDMPQLFTRSFNQSLYEMDLGFVEAIVPLADQLRELHVRAAVAGTESGVLLADQLNDMLGLPGNRRETRLARRDKYLMAKAVTAAGVRAPRGAMVSSRAEALTWYDESQLQSVVIKPLNSAGSDNVHFCTSVAEVGLACDRVVNGTNLYNERNGTALIQETIFGTEYYVNSVSVDDHHTMVESWRYTKRITHGSNVVYDFETPLDPRLPEASVLHAFVNRVLFALGVRNGAAHTEVMITSRGPVLIESGARLGGGTLPWVTEKYFGTSQTRLLARSLTGDLDGLESESTNAGWPEHVRIVRLINERAGVVQGMSWIEQIKSLPSAVAAVPTVTAGMSIDVTTDLASAPGFVYLIHAEKAVVDRDYAIIREWEREGLYTKALGQPVGPVVGCLR